MASVKYSVYDAATGKFIVYGNENSSKVSREIAAGNPPGPIGEDGGPPDFLMLTINGTVPDTERRLEYAVAKQQPNERLDVAVEAFDTFVAQVESDPDWLQNNSTHVRDAMIALRDMAIYHFQNASDANQQNGGG